jgi:hypothetical protein
MRMIAIPLCLALLAAGIVAAQERRPDPYKIRGEIYGTANAADTQRLADRVRELEQRIIALEKRP